MANTLIKYNIKKILIIDESIFSRICSAILELEGYKTKSFGSTEYLPKKFDYSTFGLLITNYPLDYTMFEKIKKINLPTIILTDHINRGILHMLNNLSQSFCMIKPLDYQKFRSLVNEIVMNGASAIEGYSIF